MSSFSGLCRQDFKKSVEKQFQIILTKFRLMLASFRKYVRKWSNENMDVAWTLSRKEDRYARSSGTLKMELFSLSKWTCDSPACFLAASVPWLYLRLMRLAYVDASDDEDAFHDFRGPFTIRKLWERQARPTKRCVRNHGKLLHCCIYSWLDKQDNKTTVGFHWPQS